MSTSSAPQTTLDAIRSVTLFASLDNEAASDLRNRLHTREIKAGTTLFRTGDIGDAMYLIENGKVRISVSDDDQKEIVLAELARGDFFGEMAIIDGKKRSADANVIDDATLAALGHVLVVSRDHRSLYEYLRRILGAGDPIRVVIDAPGDRPRIADETRRQHLEGMLRSHGLCITGSD